MKIYVTKHALTFKGTPTGISEHESSTAESILMHENGAQLHVPEVGWLNKGDYETDQGIAFEKVLQKIARRKKTLVKELESLDEQQAVIKARLQTLGSTGNSEMELKTYWENVPV